MLTGDVQLLLSRPTTAGALSRGERSRLKGVLRAHPLRAKPRQQSHKLARAAALAFTDKESQSEASAAWSSRSWRSQEDSSYLSSSVPLQTSSALLPIPVREVQTLEEEQPLVPLPRDVENLADDPRLQNPLQRLERLSTGWFGVVMEYDGVVVEDTSDLQRKAWLKVADEESKPPPPQFALRRAEGMKNDQIIKEVFCWTREPMEVRRIAERKEVILTEMLGDMQPLLVSDVPVFMDGLASNKVPAALATSTPEARLKPALESLGLASRFEAVVAAEETYRGRPDPEPYLVAAQMIGRPPARCVVIGNSNQTVEAARECGMASVVIAGRKPLYELKAADLVVKHISELRVVNLKQLFRNEDLVAATETPEPELEVEEEEDSYENTALW